MEASKRRSWRFRRYNAFMSHPPHTLSYAENPRIPREYRRAGIVMLIWGALAVASGSVLFVVALTIQVGLIVSSNLATVEGLMSMLMALPVLFVGFVWTAFGLMSLRNATRLLRGQDADLTGILGMNVLALALSGLVLIMAAGEVLMNLPEPSSFPAVWVFLVAMGLAVMLSYSLRIVWRCRQYQTQEGRRA